jgi:fatty acid desaturase
MTTKARKGHNLFFIIIALLTIGTAVASMLAAIVGGLQAISIVALVILILGLFSCIFGYIEQQVSKLPQHADDDHPEWDRVVGKRG